MKFLQSLAQTFANKPIDWDELEESLIRADLGVPMTTRIIKTLQEREAWSLNRKTRAFPQTRSTYSFAGGGGYFSRCRDRTTRDLGRTDRGGNDSRPVRR